MPAPAMPATAAEAVTMPESGKSSASRARDALKSLPFTMDDPPNSPAKGSTPPGARAGENARSGHKQTKAELEEEVRRLRQQTVALSGERPPEIAATEKQLRPALAGTFGAVFSMVAAARGPHWELPESERAQLADAWAPVLAPFMSSTAEYLPWAVAAGVTYAIVEKRVRRDSELAGRATIVEEVRGDVPAPAAPPRHRSPDVSSDRPMTGELPLDPPGRDPFAPGRQL